MPRDLQADDNIQARASPGWRVWAIVHEALKVGSDVQFAIAKSVIVPA